MYEQRPLKMPECSYCSECCALLVCGASRCCARSYNARVALFCRGNALQRRERYCWIAENRANAMLPLSIRCDRVLAEFPRASSPKVAGFRASRDSALSLHVSRMKSGSPVQLNFSAFFSADRCKRASCLRTLSVCVLRIGL